MILLDTHVLVWIVTGDSGRLPERTLEEIDESVTRGEVAVSAATFWELEVKRSRGGAAIASLPATLTLRSSLLSLGMHEVPVSGSLWVGAGRLVLSGFHRDPADQLIVGTAMRDGRRLLTADSRIISWARRTGQVALYPQRGCQRQRRGTEFGSTSAAPGVQRRYRDARRQLPPPQARALTAPCAFSQPSRRPTPTLTNADLCPCMMLRRSRRRSESAASQPRPLGGFT